MPATGKEEYNGSYMYSITDHEEYRFIFEDNIQSIIGKLRAISSSQALDTPNENIAKLLVQLAVIYAEHAKTCHSNDLYVKAANLYIRSNLAAEDIIPHDLIALYTGFLAEVGCPGINSLSLLKTCIKSTKTKLKTLRLETKSTIEILCGEPSPYDVFQTYSEQADWRRTERLYGQRVLSLSRHVSATYTNIFSSIIKTSLDIYSTPPPCAYTFIILGSLARGDATPYSDVEYALLVENTAEETLTYFRNLCWIIHMVVVGIGETVIPSLHYLCFTDKHRYEGKSWFYDYRVRGFAIDGNMPHACKHAMGRHGTTHKPAGYELIGTAEELANLSLDVLNSKEGADFDYKGYLISSVIQTHKFVQGSEALYYKFDVLCKANIEKLDTLNTQHSFAQTLRKIDIVEGVFAGRAVHIKNDFYRLPFLICKAVFPAITNTDTLLSTWELEPRIHHVSVLVSIACEIRLLSYCKSDSQLDRVACSDYTNHIVRYYLTFETVKEAKSIFELDPNDWFTSSYTARAQHLSNLVAYDDAITVLTTDSAKPLSLEDYELLCVAWEKEGDIDKACECCQKCFELAAEIYTGPHPRVAQHLDNMGTLSRHRGEYDAALSHHRESLAMRKELNDDEDIAVSLNNIGIVHLSQRNYAEAKELFSQAYKLRNETFQPPHPEIAASLNNLAIVEEDSELALQLYTQSLDMYRNIFTGPQHKIAGLLLNIGETLLALDRLEEAQTNLTASLAMYRELYPEGHESVGLAAGQVANVQLLIEETEQEEAGSVLHCVCCCTQKLTK